MQLHNTTNGLAGPRLATKPTPTVDCSRQSLACGSSGLGARFICTAKKRSASRIVYRKSPLLRPSAVQEERSFSLFRERVATVYSLSEDTNRYATVLPGTKHPNSPISRPVRSGLALHGFTALVIRLKAKTFASRTSPASFVPCSQVPLDARLEP